MSVYTYEVEVVRNSVGGGHFIDVRLYRGGKHKQTWTYDGSLWQGLAERRAHRRVRRLRDMYGAVPA